MKHPRLLLPSAARHLVFLVLAVSILSPQIVDAGKHSYGYHSRASYRLPKGYAHHRTSARLKSYNYRSHSPYYTTHRSTRLSSPYATRDSHGRIKRSQSAKHQFMKQTGYPHGRPGYVVDHVVPLSKGGADSPGNMQWQTKEEARAKDKWERGGHSSSKRLKRYSRTRY
jgi:hypothetical protein